MMATVFFMQPLGQITCNLISLIVIWGVRNQHGGDPVKAVDIIWRWVIGIGVAPGVIALFFRVAIPETPRFMLEVEKDPVKAVFDSDYLFGDAPELRQTTELSDLGQLHNSPSTISGSPGLHQDHTGGEGSSFDGAVNYTTSTSPPNSPSDSFRKQSLVTLNTINTTMTGGPPITSYTRESVSEWPLSSNNTGSTPSDAFTSPTLNSSWSLSRSDIKRFFITAGNWRSLAGLSLCWFLQDFAFYGIGLSNPQFLAKTWGGGALALNKPSPIWMTTADPNVTIYQMLMDTSIRALVILNVGSVVGGLLYIALIPYINRRRLQAYGFLFLAALFIALGCVLITLQKQGPVVIVLYIIGQIAFNFGPNGTTYTLPGELFPTRYRASCHGISAAAGKLGSIAVQIFSAYYSFGASSADEEKVKLYGKTLVIFSALMIIGSIVTFAWVPDVQDKRGKSKTLEELARGRQGTPRNPLCLRVRTMFRFGR
ncbi:hypothetical protein FH972_026734 [Carpinus fangiana]|uniref:Major facilitator superfamily (MFS) profile domain-containing protein n=1 Tax=Carpinus fangiana TaxID=176857 RepID=A0A5N6L548_9ROSI|nr:hypothetical protein FH972_026734 [Carpinus fangiana]